MIRISSHRLLLCVVGTLVAATALYAADGASSRDRRSAVRSARGTDAAESEGPFLTENQRAMDRMMAGMAVKPTGDVDTIPS